MVLEHSCQCLTSRSIRLLVNWSSCRLHNNLVVPLHDAGCSSQVNHAMRGTVPTARNVQYRWLQVCVLEPYTIAVTAALSAALAVLLNLAVSE
jgi:hypothetical protein